MTDLRDDARLPPALAVLVVAIRWVRQHVPAV